MNQLPNEIVDIIRNYILFKPETKDELQEAVNLWCENKEDALYKYGYISNWDTSLITDMRCLFFNKKDFNDNINSWNVSSVTDMSYMFRGASSFNQPLDSWELLNVYTLEAMFSGASSFNQPLNS